MAVPRRSVLALLSRLAPAIVVLGLLGARPVAAAQSDCVYKVKKGDTLSEIARRRGVTRKNLIRANPALKKNPDRLRVGQELKICRAQRLDRSSPKTCGDGGKLIVHEVGRGQTLGAIAALYGVSLKSLRQYNRRLRSRSNNMIRVGERLRVCTKRRRYTHRSWLKDGVQLAEGEGYNVRRPHNAWGLPHAVEGIRAAIAKYRELEPEAPLVQIGDLSRKKGGPLREHLSHQDGRDVDIGYVFDEDDEERRREMDLSRTWKLMYSFVQDPNVAVIFTDYGLQKRLYAHARSTGMDQQELDRIFEYPRGRDDKGILYHWDGHTRHFHVRFKEDPVPRQNKVVPLHASPAGRHCFHSFPDGARPPL